MPTHFSADTISCQDFHYRFPQPCTHLQEILMFLVVPISHFKFFLAPPSSSSALTSTLQVPWFFSGTAVNSSLFSFLGWGLSNVALVESLTQKQVPKWSCHPRTLSDGHESKPLLIGTVLHCVPFLFTFVMLNIPSLVHWSSKPFYHDP